LSLTPFFFLRKQRDTPWSFFLFPPPSILPCFLWEGGVKSVFSPPFFPPSLAPFSLWKEQEVGIFHLSPFLFWPPFLLGLPPPKLSRGWKKSPNLFFSPPVIRQKPRSPEKRKGSALLSRKTFSPPLEGGLFLPSREIVVGIISSFFILHPFSHGLLEKSNGCPFPPPRRKD